MFLAFDKYRGEKAELTVYNIYGKPVLNQSLTLDQPTHRLKLRDKGLASGSYFISIRTENGVVVRPVILTGY